ncbi:hypothetical protein P154DRAFT_346562 [Amniculicola lignicola CBS 123094]|uniref:Uncharacterized protein n=1 Tax=Amniculicola lignicola CBS 123094 TaxID=1392246 RepID=A0A6A5WCJ5_9PLEO|nr:hypothetical protein P154DRAFT_346562 [Amniculicola lignicola CBS 123094]
MRHISNMASSANERRPTAMQRQPSSSSHVSQSPSDSSHHKASTHKPQRQHVVGQGRMQRNASFGKNLNKLSKVSQQQQQAQIAQIAQAAQVLAGDASQQSSKHHRRSLSGNSTSAPSSPRPSFKRNASSGAIVRTAHHAHTAATALRKNHSSGHLARLGSSKNLLKPSKSEAAPPRKSLAHPGKARQQSPDEHPTVHFDLGTEDDAENAWTEESASQSPMTTRSNTRSNSVILDPHHKPAAMEHPDDQEPPEEPPKEPPSRHANSLSLRQPPSAITHMLPDRSRHAQASNGDSPHHNHHSRPPDADMITSRLLQRSSSHNPPPQMSAVAAAAVHDTRSARLLGQSAGSTLIDTPGRDLVSRFMDGDGSAGTPKDGSSFLPSRNSPQSTGGELDRSKRNRSMPNFAGGTETPTRHAPSRRSGTSTPTDLPTSRTQQKLLLQRASSNIEPQKLIPSILPRTGGPTFLHSGMTYTANSEGRLDPRLQQQFNHVAVEYKVVRRFRNPLADAMTRIEQIPGIPRKTRELRADVVARHHANGYAGTSSLSTSYDGGEGRGRSAGGFENRNSASPGEDDQQAQQQQQQQRFENENERVRNEAEEICRRLWESAEAGEGD